MTDYKANISESGLSIYDSISVDNLNLFIPTESLQTILHATLIGTNLTGLALRTRSKVVKEKICEALGYPVPTTFNKTQPRFPGQNFDVYNQQSNNVQIWNEEIDSQRRYVFVQIDQNDIIQSVKVLSGDQLARLDNTGTLTSKYQATMRTVMELANLIIEDTPAVSAWCNRKADLSGVKPTDDPEQGKLLPIMNILDKVQQIEGMSIPFLGASQERNRGAALHELVCKCLGYSEYEDNGSFPDIFNQLIEIKLQTSPTIDLGLHSPDGTDIVFRDADTGQQFITKDVRYIVAAGTVRDNSVIIRIVFAVNGDNFFTFFPRFQGKVQNSKLQIPLPKNFFD
jgi:hypothetical protein